MNLQEVSEDVQIELIRCFDPKVNETGFSGNPAGDFLTLTFCLVVLEIYID